MPRHPLSKIAQAAFGVDECPQKGCDWIMPDYARWIVHMWKVHKINVLDLEKEADKK